MATSKILLFGLAPKGELRIYIGLLCFLFLLISFFLMEGRLETDPRWRGWTSYTLFTAVLMLVLSSVFCYAMINKTQYAGVWERLAVISRVIWMYILTMRLLNGRRLSPVVNEELQFTTSGPS